MATLRSSCSAASASPTTRGGAAPPNSVRTYGAGLTHQFDVVGESSTGLPRRPRPTNAGGPAAPAGDYGVGRDEDIFRNELVLERISRADTNKPWLDVMETVERYYNPTYRTSKEVTGGRGG